MTKGLMSFFSTLQYSITPGPMPIGAKPLTREYKNFLYSGTRMNTDYQDIKSYKKPNICGNLWKSVS